MCARLLGVLAWSGVGIEASMGGLTHWPNSCCSDLKIWKKNHQSWKDTLTNCNWLLQWWISLLCYMQNSCFGSPAREHATQLATYWRHRGKVKSYILGDENPKLLYLTASIHWPQNQIKSLELDDGTIIFQWPWTQSHSSSWLVLSTVESSASG